MLLRWPGGIVAGRVDDDHFALNIDRAPTMLEPVTRRTRRNWRNCASLTELRAQYGDHDPDDCLPEQQVPQPRRYG